MCIFPVQEVDLHKRTTSSKFSNPTSDTREFILLTSMSKEIDAVERVHRRAGS